MWHFIVRILTSINMNVYTGDACIIWSLDGGIIIGAINNDRHTYTNNDTHDTWFWNAEPAVVAV